MRGSVTATSLGIKSTCNMGIEKPPSCNLGAFRVLVLTLLTFATHSIAYSVVYMQAKPVGFEAVDVAEIGDVSCCRRSGQCRRVHDLGACEPLCLYLYLMLFLCPVKLLTYRRRRMTWSALSVRTASHTETSVEIARALPEVYRAAAGRWMQQPQEQAQPQTQPPQPTAMPAQQDIQVPNVQTNDAAVPPSQERQGL